MFFVQRASQNWCCCSVYSIQFPVHACTVRLQIIRRFRSQCKLQKKKPFCTWSCTKRASRLFCQTAHVFIARSSMNYRSSALSWPPSGNMFCASTVQQLFAASSILALKLRGSLENSCCESKNRGCKVLWNWMKWRVYDMIVVVQRVTLICFSFCWVRADFRTRNAKEHHKHFQWTDRFPFPCRSSGKSERKLEIDRPVDFYVENY